MKYPSTHSKQVELSRHCLQMPYTKLLVSSAARQGEQLEEEVESKNFPMGQEVAVYLEQKVALMVIFLVRTYPLAH